MTLLTQKIYWTTREVADKLNVPPSKIRYWLSYFGDVDKRNKAMKRFFNQKEVEKIEKIYQLVEVEKYKLEGAKLKLK